MDLKKLLSRVMFSLIIVTVLATPVLARMGGGHGGDGMGGAGSNGGDQHTSRTDRATEPYQYGQTTADRTDHKYDSMMRLAAGSVESGGVRIQLEPESFNNGVLRVKFYADTRTGNLDDYEIFESMHLQYRDMEYEPVHTERLLGQHAEGHIEFHLPQAPDHFSIVVGGLQNMEDHVFQW
jgi:hypothetical protein